MYILREKRGGGAEGCLQFSIIAKIFTVKYYFAWKFLFYKCMYLLNHAVLYLLSNLVKLKCFRHSARNRHHCEWRSSNCSRTFLQRATLTVIARGHSIIFEDLLYMYLLLPVNFLLTCVVVGFLIPNHPHVSELSNQIVL